MKKTLAVILSSFVAATANADVTIFNNNPVGQMKVTYKVCTQKDPGSEPVCEPAKEVTLLSYYLGDNSITISAQGASEGLHYVKVESVKEEPNVIAKYESQACQADNFYINDRENTIYKSAIVLDDMHESGKVVCSAKGSY